MSLMVKQVAQAVGLPARTVRYYDHIGLASPSERSPAGYRLYSPADEGKLRFVRQAKGLGFTLDEIRELLGAAESGCCGAVVPEITRLLEKKVAEIDRRIGELRTFRYRLVDYAEGRGGGCGCQGHGAFCGCLNDVPLAELSQMGSETQLGHTAADTQLGQTAAETGLSQRDPDTGCECCNTGNGAMREAERSAPPVAEPSAGCGCGEAGGNCGCHAGRAVETGSPEGAAAT